MRPRLLLLAACLLAAAPVPGAEPEHFFGTPGRPHVAVSKSYLRVEVLNSGVDFPTGLTTRLVKVCWRNGELGAGLTLYEDYLSWNDNPGMNALFALNADYVIARDPARTGPFYSTPFELCVQAAGSFVNYPFARINACINVGYWGIGLGIEGGLIYLPNSPWPDRPVTGYAAAYVRLLTFDIGL